MSLCPACSTPVVAHARFCGACGSAVPTGCPACGAETLPGQGFCTDCGSALVDPASAGRSPAPRRRPDDRRRMRGEERRIVSVLFVDVVGWTSAAEQLDPEDLRAAQSDYFAAVRAVVEQTGGTLEKYIGDAVLACFGAPRATEDDALRAVRAALRIQDALGALRVGDAPLEARVGVATAEALVDLDADPARGQAFVTGDVVNLASRLQSAAPSGSVLVDRATRVATRETVEYDAAGPLTLKGKAEPVEAYLARAVTAEALRGPRHDLPFVGRAPQLRLLQSCLDRVIGDGAGALVSITGEPGIGKSRLVHELDRQRRATGSPRADVRELRWLAASCVSFDKSGSFAPLAALLSSWVEATPDDGEQPDGWAPERLAARLATVVAGPDADRLAHALQPLRTPGDPAGAADRRARSGAIEAWRRVMVALAEDAPTVLVLEDLHRADDALLDAVDELLALATEVPLLLVVTAWPELLERRPGWGAAGSDTVTLSLPPLDEDDAVTLIRGLLGPQAPPAALRRLVALAGGNPLYAAECAGMLRDREADELPYDLAELPLPRSVQGLVASRLDLISADEREVLHAAAVLGESCWPGPVSLLAGLPGSEVEVGLAQLARRGMLRRVRPSSVAGEPEYSFRSALVRRLVYTRLPRGRRQVQHSRAADWWAARRSGSPAYRAEVVAHHRVVAAELAAAVRSPEAGMRAEQARRALREAAERSYGPESLLPTRGYLERALALWPDDVDPVGRLSALRLALEVTFLSDRAGFVAGDGPIRVTETAATLAVLGAAAEAARAHSLLAQIARHVADPVEALRQHQAAVDLLADSAEGPQLAFALTGLARAQLACERLPDAVRTGRRAAALAEQLGLADALADALATTGVARYRTGDSAGLVDQERALTLARDGQLPALPRVARELAATLAEEGELHRSYALLDQAAADGDAASAWDGAQRACSEGDWEPALTVGPDGPPGLAAWLRLLQGEASDQLRESVAADLERARAGGSPQLLRRTLALAARCSALDGDTAQARRHHRELLSDLPAADALPSGTLPSGTLPAPVREWLPAAAAVVEHLTDETDRKTAEDLRRLLEQIPHRTRWVRAALATLASAAARRDGDRDAALAAAEEAVTVYGDIGDETERGLAVAAAAARERELRGPGRWEWELAAFAARTGAVRLLPESSPASQILGLRPGSPDDVPA